MVCAGHEDPLLLSPTAGEPRVRLDGGPPFCVAELPYPLETLTLKPGETLVLVTDGVTEAQNAARSVIRPRPDPGRRRCNGRQRDRDLSKASATEVRSFEEGTEATDDLTVMAIRYLGSP